MQDCVANWGMILGYLRVLLSWPVAALALGGAFLFLFKEAIRTFLTRVTKLKGLGAEASTPVAAQAQPVQMPELTDPVDVAAANPVTAREAILGLRDVCLFEQAYNLIFGSQMNLLHFLRSLGSQGTVRANVEPFFQSYLASAQLAERPPSIEQYLSFLIDRRLAEYVGDRLRISQFGDRFVAHIVATYTPPPHRPF